MPQPDSSRDRALENRWSAVDPAWPVDPASPGRFGARLVMRAGQRPKEKPEQDGRTPHDPDGNEELERELDEKPASHRSPTEPKSTERRSFERHASEAAASGHGRRDFETEDTSEWVATERFTLEDELEDTWPTVPTRYLDD